MSSGKSKFQIVLELIALSERAFLHKLKKKKPTISSIELKKALINWYRVRPGAEHGDGDGVPGDPSRFNK